MAISNSRLTRRGRSQRGIAGTMHDKRRRPWTTYRNEEALKRRMIRIYGHDAVLSYFSQGDYTRYDVPETAPLKPLESTVKHIPGYALFPSGQEAFQIGYVFTWGRHTGILTDYSDGLYTFQFANGETRRTDMKTLASLHQAIHNTPLLPAPETPAQRNERKAREQAEYFRRDRERTAVLAERLKREQAERDWQTRKKKLLITLLELRALGAYPLLPPPAGDRWEICKQCNGIGGDNHPSRTRRSFYWVTCKRCDGRGTNIEITDHEVVVHFHQDGGRAVPVNQSYPLGDFSTYQTSRRTTARTIILKLQEHIS